MLTGTILKGIGGFYYVAAQGTVYACRARGIFRKDHFKPLPGDKAEIVVTDETDLEGSIQKILPRKNTLFRPEVANIDQAAIVFAIRQPDLNLTLLDRYLVSMEHRDIPIILVFSKSELADDSSSRSVRELYESVGYPVCMVSSVRQEGIQEFRERLRGKVTALAGPSGVGKSTLINLLCPEAEMTTGELSRKISRGKNTTRHTELFAAGEDTWIFDTPGFSSFDFGHIEKDQLEFLFPEFSPYLGKCRFSGCSHGNEPSCAVTQALSQGGIQPSRYENYRTFYQELSAIRRY